MRKFSGSASSQWRFLQNDWELHLEDELRPEMQALTDKIEDLQDEVLELHHEVSHAQQDMKELVAQRDDMEVELRTTEHLLDKSRKENECLRELVQKLLECQRQGARFTAQADKCMDDYSSSHQRRRKREMSKSCGDSLQRLQNQGYIPVSVSAVSMSTGKTELIDLRNEALAELFRYEDEVNGDDVDMIDMTLYVKDWYNVSHDAYHELAKLCKEMPRQYKIKQRISELNSRWDIRPTPNDTHGVQQSLKDRLQIRLEHLLKTADKMAKFIVEKRVNVKLSGDGTRIGKRLHVVIFTFTLLEEEQFCSSIGNHILAVFKQPESYQCLKSALADIISDVEQLHEITVGGLKFQITFYLGGDWKFLATVTGIDSASSTYSCIWCKCRKDERGDIHRRWSLTDPENGARTIDENQRIGERSRKQYNVSNPPLFTTIPLKNVVIDNLHLFLRVSGVLIDLLIVDKMQLKRSKSLSQQI